MTRSRILLLVGVLLCSPVAAFSATDLGAREQWQHEVLDTDPRLEEPVEVELGFPQAADVAVLLVPLEQAADE
jgi:hypothetical protein